MEGVPCDAEGGGNDSETDERVFESCPQSFCEAGCVGGGLAGGMGRLGGAGMGARVRLDG